MTIVCEPTCGLTDTLCWAHRNLPRLAELDLRGGPSRRWARASWAQLGLVRAAMAERRCGLRVLLCDWTDPDAGPSHGERCPGLQGRV